MDFIIEFIVNLANFILHIDVHLNTLILDYGNFVYIILFLIIFAETGLVFTPILPGDSLLFAAGSFAALGSLDIYILFIIIFIAAVLGDAVNYHIGAMFGSKMLPKFHKIIKKEYIDKTHQFYEKHGKKTIILARFFPIVRTFAPFIAGIGNMSYRNFFIYNVAGAFLWVSVFLFAGYFLSNISFIKNNFSFFIIAIILVSVIPALLGLLKKKRDK